MNNEQHCMTSFENKNTNQNDFDSPPFFFISTCFSEILVNHDVFHPAFLFLIRADCTLFTKFNTPPPLFLLIPECWLTCAFIGTALCGSSPRLVVEHGETLLAVDPVSVVLTATHFPPLKVRGWSLPHVALLSMAITFTSKRQRSKYTL